MSWALFHKESEQFSIEAQLALKAGSFNHAAELYKKAASAEKKALDCIDKTKVRTRGIIAVSATALWYKAGEYAAAEKLAYSMLADEALPEFAREELRNLVQAIWTESVKRKADVAFIPGQVMVSVKGGESLDLIDKLKAIFYLIPLLFSSLIPLLFSRFISYHFPYNSQAIVVGRFVGGYSHAQSEPEKIQGILRAVHLDEDWLDISVGDKKLHVVGLQEAVDDVIGPMINRAVVVTVVRLKAKFKFIDIELAE